MAITIVAYNGIQQRARDARRKGDVVQIARQLQLYQVEKPPMSVGSGCGYQGNGTGWWSYADGGSGSYPVSQAECLKNAGVSPTILVDPSGSPKCSDIPGGDLNCRAYMKYTCVQSGQVVTYVYANLETLPHNTTDTDATCDNTVDTRYGMNYFVRIE